MNGFLHDLRYALRGIRKSPGFTVVAVATLALGIGANTAIFSVVRAVLLRPLPFPRADRLVAVDQVARGGQHEAMSAADFLDVAAQTRDTVRLAASRERELTLSLAGNPERVGAAVVTPNYFSVLGLEPRLGRGFLESGAGQRREVVLSHSLWVRRFGSRRDAVGENVVLDGEPASIVGVLGPGADYPVDTELWASPRAGFAAPEHPLEPQSDPAQMRGSHYFEGVGRLRDGISPERARADLDVAFDRVVSAHPDSDLKDARAGIEDLHQHEVKGSRGSLYALLGAVGLVLLIACANVANLLLARGTIRSHEIAVRTALGAGRAALVRLFLAESCLTVLAAAALGVGVAHLGTGALAALLTRGIVAADTVRIDGSVLAFTLALSIAAALLFGLWPAIRSSGRDPQLVLQRGTRTSSGEHRLTHGALVLVESGLSLLLLVGAGLLLKSLSRILAQDEGFRADRILTLATSLPPIRYADPEARVRFVDRVLENARSLPGARSAAVVSRLPLNSGNSTRSFVIEGHTYSAFQDSEPLSPDYLVASPGYFESLGIPVLAGRSFTDRDRANAPPVAVISRAMAQAFWPGESPIGKRIKNGGISDPIPWVTIVGVVGDVRQHDLSRNGAPTLYVPYDQDPWTFLTVVVRTSGAPEALSGAAIAAIRRADPDQAVFNVRPMEDVVARSIGPRRANTLLLGLFAALALLLAAVGVFSVMSFGVAQRTREIGIRVAFGARPANILRLILGDGLRWALLGEASGLVAVLALRRTLEHFVFGVRATDIATLAGAAGLLLLVATAACAVPALRALRVDPLTALRYE